MDRSKIGLGSLGALLTLATPSHGEETLWCRSLGVDQGLSQNFISTIVQDTDGFMWFGTLAGLNRWDGYEFVSFTHFSDDPTSLSDSAILALHVDPTGGIWVGTDQGIDRFDPAANAFERYSGLFRLPEGEDRLRVHGITSDQAGRVWFASFAASQLFCLDPRTREGTEHLVSRLQDLRITALFADQADRLWLATQSSDGPAASNQRACQLHVWNRCSEIEAGGRSSEEPFLTLDDEGGKVTAIAADAAGRLWLGRQGGGLLRLDPRAFDEGATGGSLGGVEGADGLRRLAADPSSPRALAHGIVRSLAVGPTGEIWAVTHPEHPGVPDPRARLHRIDPDTLVVHRVTLRQELTRVGGDATLEQLALDRSGVLWLGTNAGGLRYADVSARGFVLYRQATDGEPGLDSSYVRAICRGRDGVVWVGTPNGLNRLDRSGPEIRYSSSSTSPGLFELPHPNVQAIHEDRDGNLWIGTAGGLAVLDNLSRTPRSPREAPRRPELLSDDYVQVIHEGPDGKLWIGTLGRGLHEIDRQTRRSRHHPPDPDDPKRLPSGTIHALFSDDQARLWVGTDAGLAKLDAPATPVRQFVRIPDLNGKRILSIGQRPATPDTLWIGTAQYGLVRLELARETCQFFTSRNSALPDDTVYGILTDQRGRLWLSTNRGLVCHDPASGAFRGYGVERGLQSTEFNARAYFRAEDGEMFFGGVGGLNSFYPEEIADNPFAPTVFVTEVRITDRRAKRPETAASSIYRHGWPTRPVEVQYPQRDITFGFVALHYSDAAGNRCEYRLDDYDQAWHGPSLQRQARYTNLDPGQYTFRVRAISSHGFPSAGEATFSFVVLPPFYATGWFRVLLGLGAGSALWGTYRFRVRSLRRRQEELEDLVARRTEELQRALATVEGQAEKLQELDAAKSKFFANISHEFRTPLMLSLGPLRDVQAGLHGSVPDQALAAVELAIRNTSRQLELVEQLLWLARFDAGRLQLQPRELRLDAWLRRAAAPYLALAEHQHMRFTLETPDHPVVGQFDEGRLEQILSNLLGNALKFTPAGGTVLLRLATAPGDWAVIQVEDTGPGIPTDDLPRLFERFYQSEHPAGERRGTGLGLAVAKECVDLHGGEIRAENRPEGGARFTVRLPLLPPPPNPPNV